MTEKLTIYLFLTHYIILRNFPNSGVVGVARLTILATNPFKYD